MICAMSGGVQESRTSGDEPIPYLRLIVGFQYAAIAVSFVLLFASIIVSPLYTGALGGVVGLQTVWVYSVAAAFFAVQHAWLRARGYWPRTSAPRRGPWAHFALLCGFLVSVNAFVLSSRGLSHWGIVPGHDAPQYYAYLHSWVFDRDLDFENEYRQIPGAWDLMRENHPEYDNYNVAPIGAAVVWMPLYLAAHSVILILNRIGVEIPADGISTPYAMAAAVGSSCAVWLGMTMVFSSLRRWFSVKASFFAVTLLWVASPIIWYQTEEAWMSHAPSFFAASLVFWIWVRGRDSGVWRGRIILGCAIGLAMLVRPSHAVLLLLPIVDAARSVYADKQLLKAAGRLAAGLCAAFLVFGLQVLTWALLYDWFRAGIYTPPGSPMRWASPAMVEVLFSAHHGLFAWHPALAAGFLGLPAFWRRDRYGAAVLAVLLGLYVYGNAAIESWHGGGSFGMRRFVGALPFMAPGIAAFGIACVRMGRRHIMVPVTAAIALLFLYNTMLVLTMRGAWVDLGKPASFQQVWSSAITVFHDTFGNPFSYPPNLLFAARHHTTPAQYDVMGGNAYVQSIDVEQHAIRPYLGRGWRKSFILMTRVGGAYTAAEERCELLFHLRKGETRDLVLNMSLPSIMTEPQEMSFALNGLELGKAALPPGGRHDIKLTIPPDSARDGLNVLSIEFAHVLARLRPGSVGEPGGSGLPVRTRKPFTTAGLLWRITLTAPGTFAPERSPSGPDSEQLGE